MSDFGDTLRAIRKAYDWSQDELAERLGTTKQVLSRYETGSRVPKVTVVAEYAKKLGIPLAQMAGGEPLDLKKPDKLTIAQGMLAELTPENFELATAFLKAMIDRQ